jgi:hypothetical protein
MHQLIDRPGRGSRVMCPYSCLKPKSLAFKSIAIGRNSVSSSHQIGFMPASVSTSPAGRNWPVFCSGVAADGLLLIQLHNSKYVV